MPVYSTLRSFVNAIRSGDTNITQCLERLANDRAKRAQYATDIHALHAGVGQLPGWLRNEMVQAGMSQPEVDHVERWPDAEKEKVRVQVVEALEQDRNLHFSWELFAGDDPVSEVRRDPNQDVRVVFLSPRKGVILSALNHGDVKVER
jgi:hypothetical protein